MATGQRKRLTPSQEADIIEAYRSWDGSETVVDFAHGQGISKQALYGLLRRRGIRTRTQEAFMSENPDNSAEEMAGLADWMMDKVATQVLKTILEENRRVHSLEDRVERLERRLRDLGEDPTTM
jgi:hypothetical protein